MSDNDAAKALAEQNVEEIKRMEATQKSALGNVHSEPDEPTDQTAPPPLPH